MPSADALTYPAGGIPVTDNTQTTVNIAVFDAAGNKSTQTLTGLTVVAANPTPQAPGAPTVTATPGQGSLAVTWAAPAEGASAILRYLVTATAVAPATGTAGSATIVAPTTTATLNNLSAGVAYTVSVVAVNAQGQSPAGTTTATTQAVTNDRITIAGGRYRAGDRLEVNGTGTIPGAIIEIRTERPDRPGGRSGDRRPAGRRGNHRCLDRPPPGRRPDRPELPGLGHLGQGRVCRPVHPRAVNHPGDPRRGEPTARPQLNRPRARHQPVAGPRCVCAEVSGMADAPARFKDLCLDARDHQTLADWWCAALGYVRRDDLEPSDDEPRPRDWPVPIVDPSGAGPLMWIVPVPEPKTRRTACTSTSSATPRRCWPRGRRSSARGTPIRTATHRVGRARRPGGQRVLRLRPE